ncbi:hypothetical protein ACFX14_023411 [Malus domestica]
MLRTQYFSVITVLRSDNGGEYINRELSEFRCDQGILHETTCPYTPQQNGVAERKNRHILETARALLLGASVPKIFWPEAVTYAVYVINRMPSRVVNFRTPFQGESSSGDLEWLDLEGIPVVDAVHNEAVIIHAKSDKFASSATDIPRQSVAVSNMQTAAESSMQSGLVPEESDMQSGQIVVEPTDVTPSLSSSIVLPNESSLDIPEVSIVDDYVTNASNDVNTYKLPPRQNRGVPPDRFSPEGKVKYPIANYVSCNGLAPERKTLVNNMEATRVPTRVEEALKDPNWANAMDEEMLALQKNNTWEVTSFQKGKKQLAVGGCSLLNTKPMDQSTGTKQGW